MGHVTYHAGERDLYLYWDELPPHSRQSLPAFKISRQWGQWRVTGVRVRPSEGSIVEVGSFVYEPGLSLAWHLPRDDNVLFGGDEPIGPDWDAIRAWLKRLGFDFTSDDEVQEIVRNVPISLLASFSCEIAAQRLAGRSLTASDRHCLLWSLSPGWEWLYPPRPSHHHRLSVLAEKLRIPIRSARRFAMIGLCSGLDSAPTPYEAALLALGLHQAPLDLRIGRGGRFAVIARSFAIRWREAGSDPLMLWVRALQLARTRRWCNLLRDLPLADEELLAWLNQLLRLAQEHEPDPVKARALVAGWVSKCDLEELSDALLEAEVEPVEPADGYMAETPIRSTVRVGALSVAPLLTANALRSHPCVGHLSYPEAQIRCLLEGDAWYFDFIADSGPRGLAVFRDRDEYEALMIVSEDRLVTTVEPWLPLIDVIRPLLDANPHVRGSAAYRAALEDRMPVPLPRSESLEAQLAWAGQQAQRLGAHEFIEAAIRLRESQGEKGYAT